MIRNQLIETSVSSAISPPTAAPCSPTARSRTLPATGGEHITTSDPLLHLRVLGAVASANGVERVALDCRADGREHPQPDRDEIAARSARPACLARARVGADPAHESPVSPLPQPRQGLERPRRRARRRRLVYASRSLSTMVGKPEATWSRGSSASSTGTTVPGSTSPADGTGGHDHAPPAKRGGEWRHLGRTSRPA